MFSPSARSGRPPSDAPSGSQAFPKSRRLLKRSEFRKVYDEGERWKALPFTAFVRRTGRETPARFGVTASRALGKAVVRNRVKRRLREAIRLSQREAPAGAEIVLHARRPILEAGWPSLQAAVRRVCARARRGRPRGRRPAASNNRLD